MSRDYVNMFGHHCLVCGLETGDCVAPLGIISGSFPCHVDHSDKAIHDAYVDWLNRLERGQAGDTLPR